MSLSISLRSELQKTKGSSSFTLTLIAAAIIPAMYLLNLFTSGLPDENNSIKDPLNAIFRISFEMVAMGIFPLFVILICTLLPQIEYRNNTWKQVLASPQELGDILAAKFLTVQAYLVLFLLANHIYMWLIAITADFMIPQLHVLHRPLNAYVLLNDYANAYTGVFALCTIQFWLGLKMKNLFVPLGIGVGLWLVGTILALQSQSVAARYFPYSFQTFSFVPGLSVHALKVRWTSVGYGTLILLGCFFDFERRRVSGGSFRLRKRKLVKG